MGQISQSDIARLKELSNQLKSSVQENISDFRGLAKAKTKLELKTTLGAKASQEDVNNELIKLSTNVYEDLSGSMLKFTLFTKVQDTLLLNL